MKLVSCYVSSFGALKDFSYEFVGGLNTVKEDNGWGKSTFASFIKAMFYGLDDTKRTLEDNERKRFTPWNSTEKFGGSLIFEWKEKRYKIERFFGAKSSEDTVKLYDLSTNKAYTDGAAVENLGKRVFSIDEEGFLSTTCFSQKDFEIKSNTSITAKYNEVCEIQDSDAFDGALKKLDEKIKELKSRGDKGKIADIKRRITETEDGIERTKQSVKTIENHKADLAVIKTETDNLEKNIKILAEKLDRASKREAAAERKKRYDAINAEIAGIRAEKAATEKILNGKAVTLAETDFCDKCIRDLYDVRVKRETLENDVADYAPAENTAKPVKRSKTPVFLAIAGALSVIAGAVIALFGMLWGLSFVGAGIIAAAAAVATAVSLKGKAAGERDGGKLAEIYARKKLALSECVRDERELLNGLDSYFSAFVFPDGTDSYEQKAGVLKDAAKMRAECDGNLKKLTAELDSLVISGVEVSGDGMESVEKLNEDIRTANAWYKEKINESERIKMRIAALEADMDSLIDAENRRAELKEQLAESEREFKILTLTAEYMKRADESLKTRYRLPLQNSLCKYLKMIAGENISASIDTDMRITVNARGAERETEFFSKGYRNLFEICKRFALTDILFTVEKPFIILDDPFYNLDDGKVSAALTLIKQLADEYQIIYLVCHKSRQV